MTDINSLQGGASREDIAIIGMSCLFAGAPDLDTYWRNIVSKTDSISDPPADEWDPAMFYDPESKSNDRVYCKRGGYIGDLASFRPSNFGVMPVTVDGGEPDQWLALRVAHEALADAGYTETPKESERTQVIIGKGTYVNRGNLTVGYHGMTIEYVLQILRNLHPEYTEPEIQEVKRELKAGLPPFSADTAPALIGNIIAGRIANRLDLMGPSYTVDAACASALLAIDIGVRDLQSHKCDLVLAGGANANAPLPTLSLFCQLGALSRKQQIRPFDKNADGTILGEGLGMIILKRRSDAVRDGNRIYACIKGVGMASDGRALHVMAPRVEGEELALQRAYEMANVAPETVGLIEAHGTATPVGDVVEMEALSRVFGKRKGSLPSCAVGSVKSMIGHTMPAAGIAGVIKSALALYHRVLPPTIHCDEPNPALNLEMTPFYINTETRPWIHGAGTPRRAGVNSFGFGGINGHVVLEENADTADENPGKVTDSSGYQLHWDTEVCILEASSRQELIERGDQLKAFLRRAEEVFLKDVAYSLNSRLEGKPSRLAIVAASVKELEEKLTRALGRIADPTCKQIKDNQGIYFFDRPLEGKLAFIFPGEGAQYPNMLLDLCMHFPEVRRCFDLADRAIFKHSGKCLPSEFIFPRSLLSKSEQAEIDKALWQIDGAVEGVLVANWAMWTLLNLLEIRPDAIMGHSTGDYSAMFASKVIGISGDESYVETIVAWNEAHARLAAQLKVPEVMLVAVASDSAVVLSLINEVGGELYLAMDNCPHQSVLLGSKAAVEQAIEILRSRALIYEILPFDRPYHTPLFHAYAEGAGQEFFARLPISAPAIDLYSCTTASRYPADVAGVRKLFVDHWEQPVLFTKTVETMYEEGIRIFVEAGPRGNLTAFVSDILRGKPHLAMPANVARRSGITQLNHLAGVLAAQGVGMRLDFLYARRNPARVLWDQPKSTAPVKAQSPNMKLSLAIPNLRVQPRKAKKPSEVAREAAQVPAAPLAAVSNEPQPVAKAAAASASTTAVQQYMKGMEAFLDVEQKVMQAFLNRARATAPGSAAAAAGPAAQHPLLGSITSMTPGQALTATRQLNLQEDRFLREHALGGPVSVTDPELRPLIVVPLTMTMEVMAEAAAALMPEQLLTGMRDIQASHWIRVDDSPVNLYITARRLASSLHEVEVEVRDGAASPASLPAAKGVVIFSSEYARAPQETPGALQAERVSRLAESKLYDGRLMFHGPAFQGVAGISRSGQDGIRGQLQILPSDKMFRSNANAAFVTDPVVLDAAGQLVGFWAAEYLEKGFVVFPYRLDSLAIYGPKRPAGDRLDCRVKLQLLGNERIRSNIDIVAADGKVWMQFQGWEDRRFDPPPRFHRAWTAPHEAQISEAWAMPLSGLPGGSSFECHRVGKLFEPGSSLWLDLWASLILTRRERQAFLQIREPEAYKTKWLQVRTAAKDAARAFLKHHRKDFLPADIEIAEDEHGNFTPQGSWTGSLAELPQLSVAYANGAAVAFAAGNRAHYGFQMDFLNQERNDTSPALTAGEQDLLGEISAPERNEWSLRLRCAKNAAANAAFRAALALPQGVLLSSLDVKSGVLHATLPNLSSKEFVIYTAIEGGYVTAIAILEKEKQ